MLVPFVVVMKLLYRIFQVKSSEIQGQGALKSHRFGRKSEEICRNSTEIFWKGRGSFGQCSNTSDPSTVTLSCICYSGSCWFCQFATAGLWLFELCVHCADSYSGNYSHYVTVFQLCWVSDLLPNVESDNSTVPASSVNLL